MLGSLLCARCNWILRIYNYKQSIIIHCHGFICHGYDGDPSPSPVLYICLAISSLLSCKAKICVVIMNTNIPALPNLSPYYYESKSIHAAHATSRRCVVTSISGGDRSHMSSSLCRHSASTSTSPCCGNPPHSHSPPPVASSSLASGRPVDIHIYMYIHIHIHIHTYIHTHTHTLTYIIYMHLILDIYHYICERVN